MPKWIGFATLSHAVL